jgi:hypothetical protein
METDATYMSMLRRRFLIRPANSFLSILSASESDLACILRENRLWTHMLGQRTRITEPESARFVKMLHVCNLVAEYGNDTDLELLTGPPEQSIAYFDAHWEIINVDDEVSANDVFARLPKTAQECIEQVLAK